MEKLSPRKTVNLWCMAGVGIIIPAPTGIFYANQTGGYSCGHPFLEGFFVPLTTGGGSFQNTNNTCPLANELLSYFTGPPWGGHCYGGINQETADHLDQLFQKYRTTKILRVSRDLMPKSEEAWIHVTLEYPDKRFYLLSGIDPLPETAVLTWPNSD